MKQFSNRFSVGLFLLAVLFTCIVRSANADLGSAPTIDAAYTIYLDIPARLLRISVRLSNLPRNDFLIGFRNSFQWAEYKGTDLAARIRDFSIDPEQGSIVLLENNDDVKLCSVAVKTNKSITFTYTFDTNAVPYDTHFTTLTPTYVHIPGLDFFIRFYAKRDDVERSDGLDNYRRYDVAFENLPSTWSLLSTYPSASDNSVYIDNRTGGEVLLNAGDYKSHCFALGQSHITIAFDSSLQCDAVSYLDDIERIYSSYWDTYRHLSEKNYLVLVNQSPGSFLPLYKSFGGQVKTQNILDTVGFGWGFSAEQIKTITLGIMAHEAHHIWLSHGYHLAENVYWFQEGFTEYVSIKTLYTLGIISKEYFERQIYRQFTRYAHCPLKNQMNLVQASLEENSSDIEDMTYGKGATVAYLLDKALRKRGQTLERFLSDFYRAYAIPQRPIDNKEIIGFIDDYLGDASFTGRLVLGTDIIRADELILKTKMPWWSIEPYLPPVPFPFNALIPLVALLMLLVLVFGVVRGIRRFRIKRLGRDAIQ